MQNDLANREKKSELFEIHLGFQEQGKRLSDCLSRLTLIGNKLEDDSSGQSANKMQEPSPRNPGITSDLYNCVDGFRINISQIEQQILKIEKHI